ncbi:MAG TPA: hypothetical protein VKQ34_00555 [Candidatus Saccharimonadales bacterium]|nr:hypothetical protein [Candidatus Saccharimonadales bacterium]
MIKARVRLLREWFNQHENQVYVGILLAVAIGSHLLWFKPGTALFNNDWLHRPNATMPQAWDLQALWKGFLNFGVPNVQIGYFLVTILWPVIGFLGGSFDAAVKLTVMIPITLLGFLGPYFVMRRLLGQQFVAFVCALFYGTTTYFLLLETVQLPIAFVYALSPVVVLCMARALDSMRLRDWLLFAVVYTIGACYEVRIMYIVTAILALQVVVFADWKQVRKAWWVPLLTGAVLVGLNAFWLLPSALGGVGSTITQLTNGLFGNWLFDLPHAITLSASNWTGGATSGGFTLEPILPYLWIVPVVAFVPLALGVHILPKPLRAQILFFLPLAVIGIFLTKQVLDPLPQAYPWLYAHFPGFSLFREASKFYLLTAWGYMGLIGLGLMTIRRIYRSLFWVAAVGIVAVACINLRPLVTGDIATLFKGRNMPADYAIVNAKIAADPPMTRALWVPTYSQWAYFDVTHPKVSATAVMGQEWAYIANSSDASSLHARFTAMLSGPLAEQAMNAASIHWVVVPLRDSTNDDNIFNLVGNNRQFYIDTLNNVPWLKRVNAGTQEVALYENTHYQPPVTVAANMVNFASQDISTLYNFYTTAVGQPFNFAFNDKRTVNHGSTLQDVFGGTTPPTVTAGKLSRTIASTSGKTTLFINTNAPTLKYQTAGGVLQLIATERSGILVDGKPAGGAPTQSRAIGQVRLDPARQYFTEMQGLPLPLPVFKDASGAIGPADKTTRILSTSSLNLIPNASLEQGLWQKDVDDCDPFDGDAPIGLDLDQTEHTDGHQSLVLNAISHTACTGPPPVRVSAGQEYMLRFDYKDYQAEDGDEVGYQVTYNDPAHTTLKKYLAVPNGSWHTVRLLVTPPAGATTFTFKLLAVPRLVHPAITYYDNLNFTPVRADLTPQLNLTPQYTTVPLGNRSIITYADAAYSGRNLIPNPSLEQGLWQKNVGDCNAYDDAPELAMSLSGHASAGHHSLQLAARRHIACTGPGLVPVDAGATYLLGFDHQSGNADAANYSVTFDDPDQTIISGNTPTKASWQTFTRPITVPPGAHHASLLVYAWADDTTAGYTINRYDNFRLIKIPTVQNQYFIVQTPSEPQAVAPKQVSYAYVKPTQRAIHIQNARAPFYVTLSEAYHPDWRLELQNAQVGWSPLAHPQAVSGKDHVAWDGFLNAWYVDPTKLCAGGRAGCTHNADGSYNMNLVAEFTAQRWFTAGAILSVCSAGLVILYLMLSLRQRPVQKGYRRWRR